MEHLINFDDELRRKYSDELIANIENWTRNQKRNLHKNLVLIDDLYNSEKYQTLHRLLRTRIHILQFLLRKFQHNVNYQCRCKNSLNYRLLQAPLFWISYSQIQGELKIKREMVASSMVLFNLLGLIYKLNDEQVGEVVLTEGKRFKEVKKYKSHINYYFVPSYTVTFLNKVEKRAIELKNLHFGLKSANRQWVLRTLGREYADVLFPQYVEANATGTTEISNIKTERLTNEILERIEDNGYIFQNTISHNYQWGISKHEILSRNNLICEFSNKELKERFNINRNGYIIYRQN